MNLDSPLDDAKEESKEPMEEDEGEEKMKLEVDEEVPEGDGVDVIKEEGEEEKPDSPEEKGIEDEVRGTVEGPDRFEMKTFRMVVPIPSKSGDVVLQATIDMILKLRLDGFEVFQVHSDNGGEFTSAAMRKWMRTHGYVRTYTGVADPQANGRAENAVQQVKNQVRRLLLQAGMEVNQWPIAARYADEQLRNLRLGRKQKFPPLGKVVLTKKRAWRAREFAPTMERVTYLCPSWESHGHWIRRQDVTKIVTRFYIAKVEDPEGQQAWIGLMEDLPDPVEVRRRLRGKQPPWGRLRKAEGEGEVEEEKDPLKEATKVRARALQMIMEEMAAQMEDVEGDMMIYTMTAVTKLRAVMEVTGEAEEVLQTKIVGAAEVIKDWELWKKPIHEELVAD